MNYRTMVKGALAFSLSLIVGSASAAVSTNSVPQYGVTFEDAVSTTAPLNDRPYVADTLIGTNNTTEAGDSYGWFSGSEEDESKIIAANGGQALQLNTDSATLTNKLASADKTAINNAIAADGAFFETEIKFVASDSLDAGIKGGEDATKFAIYAYCDENATPCTTNLVVYHAYVDLKSSTGISYTNDVTDVLIDVDKYAKLRVEMKQVDLDGDGTMVNAFSVKIDAGDGIVQTISTRTAFDESTCGVGVGSWFLTVEDSQGEGGNALVSSLNFKGTGEIDNINIGVIQIETTSATVIFVAEDGTTPLDNQTLEVGAIPAYAGEASGTNNTATAEGIKTFTGWTCGDDFYAVGTALPAAVNGETTYVATFDTDPAVASVNGNYYATLEEAIAAAANGDTVLLNDDVDVTSTIIIDVNKAITLDLGGNAIAATDARAIWVKSGDVTITNGTVSATATAGSSFPDSSSVIRVGDAAVNAVPAKLTIAANTTVSSDYCYGVTAFGKNNDGDAATTDIVLDVYGTVSVTGTASAISGNGTSTLSPIAVGIHDGAVVTAAPPAGTTDVVAIYFPGAGTLAIDGGRVTGPTAVYAKAGDIAISGGELVATGAAAAPAYNGNGCYATGDALVIDNCGYPNAVSSAQITGGTFRATDPEAKTVASIATGSHPGEIVEDIIPAVVDGQPNPARFSDAEADGIPEGYELVADGETGLYKIQGKTYTVTFMNGEAEFAVSNDVPHGAVVAAPDPAPTKAEDATYTYTFKEWQLGGVAYDFGTGVTSNFTLVADFTATEKPAPSAGYKETEKVGDIDSLTADQADWLNGLRGETGKDAYTRSIKAASLLKCYLLNCDPTAATSDGTLSITAIAVDTDVKVTIALERTGELGAIKGTLKLLGATDLATGFGTESVVDLSAVTFAEDGTYTATFSGVSAKFFKAVIE